MAGLQPEWNISFRGGQNDSAPATAMRADEAAVLLNYRVTAAGEAEVRHGSQRTHTAALNAGARGYGGVEFTTAGGVVQWVVFAGDSAYYSTDRGANWTLIASGLTQACWDFAPMRVGASNVLYCANGSATMYTWNGASWAALAGPATGCTRVEVHNDRLWATDGRFLYGSKIRDPAVWTGVAAVSLPFTTHDGDGEVVALYSLGPWLLVFKRRSIGYVEGFGASDIITASGSRGISRDVGCSAWRSLVPVGGNGLMWLSRRGFEFYRLGGEPVVVSRSVATFMEAINWSDIEADPSIPAAYYYPDAQTYECAIPGTANRNDQVFVYRVPVAGEVGAASFFDAASSIGQAVTVNADGFLVLGGSGRLRTRDGFLEYVAGSLPGVHADTSTGFLALATNNTTSAAVFSVTRGADSRQPVSVGYDGFVRVLDTGARDDVLADGSGGVAIGDKLRTRPMVFRDLSRRKRGRRIRVQAVSGASISPEVLLVSGGVDGPAHVVEIDIASGGQPREGVARVNGRGTVLQAEIRSAGAGTKVSAVAIEAEVLEVRR